MNKSDVVLEFEPFYYSDSTINRKGLTVVYPEEIDELDDDLPEWKWQEAKQHNRWVDEIKVKLFSEGWHPAIELPYTWNEEKQALVVTYEIQENEYSLSSIRHSYFSPRGWEQLLYEEEGFYPAVPIKEVYDDYVSSLSEFYGLDDYGFIKNSWGLLYERDFYEYPAVM